MARSVAFVTIAMLKMLVNSFKNTLPGKTALQPSVKCGHQSAIPGNKVQFMVFGDSNACRPEPSYDCWPAMLERKCNHNLQVINESYDGRTTQYDKGECNGLIAIERIIRHNRQMEYAVVALGTNDVKDKYGPPKAADVIEGVHLIIETIIRYCPSINVALMTPPPIGRVACGALAGAQKRIPPLAAEYRRYAISRGLYLVDLYPMIDVNADLDADNVHLNALGRKKTVDEVRRFASNFICLPA